MDVAAAEGASQPGIRVRDRPTQVMPNQKKVHARRKRRKELVLIQICLFGGLLVVVKGFSYLAEHSGFRVSSHSGEDQERWGGRRLLQETDNSSLEDLEKEDSKNCTAPDGLMQEMDRIYCSFMGNNVSSAHFPSEVMTTSRCVRRLLLREMRLLSSSTRSRNLNAAQMNPELAELHAWIQQTELSQHRGPAVQPVLPWRFRGDFVEWCSVTLQSVRPPFTPPKPNLSSQRPNIKWPSIPAPSVSVPSIPAPSAHKLHCRQHCDGDETKGPND
ncbi:hypothetical protein EYF80_011941 [Liparis tanakae]|uniref:Uncharacterized protein n=1 Tax=Liparis tanakae TaxID=230148 RepID=A0A4Z2IK83_9TELE|nr:hypothetical protein EYF80_011941 [Liparis tanakae]